MAMTPEGYEQLEMFRMEEPDKSLPWDGRSPRTLTRAYEAFRLHQRGASLNAEDARIDEQCRRHQYGW